MTWQAFDRLTELGSVAARARKQVGMAKPLGFAASRARRTVAPDVPRRRRVGRRPGLDDARRGLWALRALLACRAELARGAGLDQIRLPAPPAGAGSRERGIGRALGTVRATCLERALIRRCWLRSRGEDRELVLGVTAPSRGFSAHAWLEGDREDASAFTEILRRPADPG